jgi:hypothetical protein
VKSVKIARFARYDRKGERCIVQQEVYYEKLSQICSDINTVSSFCDCIAGEETVELAAQAFCNKAKTDKNITGDDLADLKIALMALEDEACCDC